VTDEDVCDEGVTESGRNRLGYGGGVTVRGEARRHEEKSAEYVVVI
jgi:hypothetical protein